MNSEPIYTERWNDFNTCYISGPGVDALRIDFGNSPSVADVTEALAAAYRAGRNDAMKDVERWSGRELTWLRNSGGGDIEHRNLAQEHQTEVVHNRAVMDSWDHVLDDGAAGATA